MTITEQIELFILEHLKQGVVVLSVVLSPAAFREFSSLCAPLDSVDKSGKIAHIRVLEAPRAAIPIQAYHFVKLS